MTDYNVNVHPLTTEYNNINNNYAPLTNIDSLNYIRGSGNFNPAPIFPQTNNYGNAYSNIDYNKLNKESNNYLYQKTQPIQGNIYVSPMGAVNVENTWENNINSNIKFPDNNYNYYDEYQNWALKVSRKSDPYLLPYLFSKINVKFIQDSVVKYIKQYRNITIETKQDIENLLNLMMQDYILYYNSNGIYGNNNCATKPNEEPSCNFSNILANLNKNIIEKYVKKVLSGLNMNEYYIKDISQLPIPLSNPVLVSNKGSKVLGHVGFFENNHEFTKNIDSFNSRDLIPGKLNSLTFGN